ncbi:CocE/NonD family hydrolase [Microbacterium suwonense]|uniref:X-Pro dipeptidyl-peptidase n=1 Tax=Microbacterium suwonense TaxID=683047 RepID=A0ABN6X645_9MICO|nr:CocE/NonD family hydrolase [Microbacterium suwonense]BDZ40077.1 X-Pro dipeptidyl-peptidase [Microbacterium suwonense]
MSLQQKITRAMDARGVRPLALGPYEIDIHRDLRVPMDDGVELLADLIVPIGGGDPSMPTVVLRSPYGRRGPIASGARRLAYAGCTVLVQSCRGTGGSPGRFHPQVNEQRDGIATHRWVRGQSWFTGHLATFGPSYLGYVQWAIAGKLQRDDPETAPEALVLQVTMPDFGAVTWDNNAFALRNALGWTRMMRKRGPALIGMLLPDRKLQKGFETLPLGRGDEVATGESVDWYQDWVRHEKLTDEYWTQQSHTASVPDVTAPVLMLTGWYDIFLPWQLRTYAQLVEAGNPPRLTVGPWGHSSPEMEAPLLDETLDLFGEIFGSRTSTRTAPVRAYLTGAEEWRELATWPPAGTHGQEWVLHADGVLSPGAASGGTTRYRYDPDAPTPAVGGPSLTPDTLPQDNRAHERRDDVVVFRGSALTEPVTIAGKPAARIRFRSSRPSYDIFVRITDTHPDGRVLTVCDGIRRIGSVGSVVTDPEPDAEGWREVEIPLWPVFHRFAPGHRIGVQVSSGAHPRYARNPGSVDPAFSAVSAGVADQEISHDGPSVSRIELPVWES